MKKLQDEKCDYPSLEALFLVYSHTPVSFGPRPAGAHFSGRYGAVTEQEDKSRRIQRHSIATQRDCSLEVITFDEQARTDHLVQLVDLSVTGVGIESSKRVDPGLVWFRDRVGGYKCGVIAWSKQNGERYRAGIQFVSLTRDEEQYIQEQVRQSRPYGPLRDPQQLIATMIASLKKDRRGN